jgi:hypothetical protein
VLRVQLTDVDSDDNPYPITQETLNRATEEKDKPRDSNTYDGLDKGIPT